MGKKLKNLLIITLFSTVPTFLIWFPFFLRIKSFWKIPIPQNGMATVVANYDGPLFIVVAKTFYKPDLIENFPFTLPTKYYAAHFPFYPNLIKFFSLITNFPYAMLLVTLLSSILTFYFFYNLISDHIEKKDLYWAIFTFAVFPARFLIVRSVGSPEPLFIATIIASLLYFKKGRFLLAGIWGAIATLTKPPGILLFLGYFLYIILLQLKNIATISFSRLNTEQNLKKILPLSLIPLALLLVFTIFKIQMKDFLAYFHSGDNIHLFFPPFQIFNYSAPWVGTFWLEEILFVYLFVILGIYKLIQKKEYEYASFTIIFFTSLIFIVHRDLIRYALPIVPLLFVAFSDTIVKKEFKIAMILLVIPIYLFSITFISQNVMPISDWTPLL